MAEINLKAKLEELQNDKEFMDKLADAKTVQDVRALLDAKDIEMSDDEIERALGETDQELSVEELENVSGGLDLLTGAALLLFLIGVARGSKCK
jgi:predicted ribosomally synthesized peptide with nif11-like leader